MNRACRYWIPAFGLTAGLALWLTGDPFLISPVSLIILGVSLLFAVIFAGEKKHGLFPTPVVPRRSPLIDIVVVMCLLAMAAFPIIVGGGRSELFLSKWYVAGGAWLLVVFMLVAQFAKDRSAEQSRRDPDESTRPNRSSQAYRAGRRVAVETGRYERYVYPRTRETICVGDVVEIPRFLRPPIRGVISSVYDPTKPSIPWGDNEIGFGVDLGDGSSWWFPNVEQARRIKLIRRPTVSLNSHRTRAED